MADDVAALTSERELLQESTRIYEERLRALQARAARTPPVSPSVDARPGAAQAEEVSLRAHTSSAAESSLAAPAQPALMLTSSKTPSRAAAPARPAESPASSTSARGAQLATPGMQELLLDTLGADSPWLAADPTR